jgi:transcriptional regulator of arginine metabolism
MVVSTSPTTKRARQRAILEIVARTPIASQEELVEQLAIRGVQVTQATISRDVAELRLVKLMRGDRHVYVSPDDLANTPDPDADGRLGRLLDETPVTVGRSGLILVVRGPVGSAQALARAIDQSGLREQEGTLAGDDTVLVLFADEDRLAAWHRRFRALQGLPSEPQGARP